MEPILNAIAYAHKSKVIHRDLKPSNILLQPEKEFYTPKVADFGLAKAARTHSISVNSNTKSGVHLGTPRYSSPEQIDDSKRASYPSDVYSLGLILYELTTGRPPFDGEGYQLMYSHCYEAPPPPSKFNKMIPNQLEELILQCLDKNPKHRHADAGELYKALQSTLTPNLSR